MRESFELDGVRVAQSRLALSGEDGKPFTQAAFAALADLHPVTMNRIEGNKTRVSLAVLEKLSELTGQSRAYLLGEDEPLDDLELAKERFATALEKMQSGFEDFHAAVELLTERTRAAEPDEVAA